MSLSLPSPSPLFIQNSFTGSVMRKCKLKLTYKLLRFFLRSMTVDFGVGHPHLPKICVFFISSPALLRCLFLNFLLTSEPLISWMPLRNTFLFRRTHCIPPGIQNASLSFISFFFHGYKENQVILPISCDQQWQNELLKLHVCTSTGYYLGLCPWIASSVCLHIP